MPPLDMAVQPSGLQAMMGSAGFAMALSNILARSTMACYWVLPTWANGASGDGLVRSSVRKRAAAMSASTEEVFGTGHCCRKIALFWRCARIWSSRNKVSSSDSVWEKDLNTSH